MSMSAGYYRPMPCAQVATFYPASGDLLASYPACADLEAWVVVKADFFGRLENIAAGINASFGMAWWLGLAINAIAVELYVGRPARSLVIADIYSCNSPPAKPNACERSPTNASSKQVSATPAAPA